MVIFTIINIKAAIIAIKIIIFGLIFVNTSIRNNPIPPIIKEINIIKIISFIEKNTYFSMLSLNNFNSCRNESKSEFLYEQDLILPSLFVVYEKTPS